MFKYLLIAIVAILLLGGAIYLFTDISYQNTNTRLKNTIKGKIQEEEAYYDKLWKIISQKAQIADQYKNAFKEIYPELIKGRYSSGGGQLMQWITEHNPEFDASLYKDLMTTIEGERNGFFTCQKQLIDLNREHRNLLQTFPGNYFLNPADTIHITIISSTASKKVMESGIEDNIELFKK
jgi:hypothetical protein